jgi:hypothetical protein
MRVRDWRVRTKLAAVLVVPSVAFLILAGLQTGTVASRAAALDEFSSQVRLGRQITALVQELQLERDRTVGELAALGNTANPGQASARLTAVLQPIHRSVDGTVDAFRRAAQPLANGSAAWRSAYNDVLQNLDQLGDLRTGVLGGALRGASVLDGYTRTVDSMLTLLSQPTPGKDQAELSQPVLTYVELANVKEIDSLLRARLFAVATAGRFVGSDVVDLSDLRTQQLAAVAQFQSVATVAQVQLFDRTLNDDVVKQAATLQQKAAASAAAGGQVDLDPVQWWTKSTAEHNLIRSVETQLLNQAIQLADSRSSAQWRQTVLVAGLILAVLLVAMGASVLVGRSMARSLRQLRGQALTIAQLQLPQLLDRMRTIGPRDPVPDVAPPVLRSSDEIGEVAEAFHAVHRSAVHLAVEQAIMRRNVNAIFVNLARRSQVLVERQLELLDRLERDEGDPDQLANLFQLDHLAARMRRNDDNLLVLAGSESRRRWVEPVALATVVLAAIAEIEQYPRVRHDIGDSLFVAGPAVGDLAHLLAELLENATLFSPPDGTVLVSGQSVHNGRAAIIEIVDSGIGMSQQALAEANATLAEPPPVDVAAAERMGLVVVSHLAARHGVRVQLRPGTPGLMASVWLPAELLAKEPPQPALPAGHSANGTAPATLADVMAAGEGGRHGRPTPALAREASMSAAARAGRRGVPTRAEDVLGAADPAPSGGTAWWSRPEAGSEPAQPTGALPAGPPKVPITGGTNERGLPVRVPMAQLPADNGGSPGDRTVTLPAQRVELDPDAVGGALSRFYGGVRKAEAEDVVVPVVPAGQRPIELDVRLAGSAAEEERW